MLIDQVSSKHGTTNIFSKRSFQVEYVFLEDLKDLIIFIFNGK